MPTPPPLPKAFPLSKPPSLATHSYHRAYQKKQRQLFRKRVLVGVVLGLIGFVGALLAGQQLALHSVATQRIENTQSIQKRHLAEFLKDQKELQTALPFENLSQIRDAGPYLNGRLPWRQSKDTATLSLPSSLMEQLKRWKGNFLDHAREIDYSQVKLEWMAGLLEYDHWDVDKNSPIEKLYFKVKQGKRSPNYFFTQTPLPDYQTLLRYGNLAWMKAHETGDYAKAGRELRHLARLLYTTEYLPLTFTALTLLKMEAVVGRQVKSKDWDFLNDSNIETATRALRGYVGYWNLSTPQDILAKLFMSQDHSVGVCQAIREGIYHTFPVSALMKHRIPLEDNLESRYRALDKTIEANAHRCRLTFHKEIWLHEVATVQSSLWQWSHTADYLQAELFPSFIYKIPFVRKAVGYNMAQWGVPQAFRDYERSRD